MKYNYINNLRNKKIEQLERENHILKEKLINELENHIDENIELKEKVRSLQIQLLKLNSKMQY